MAIWCRAAEPAHGLLLRLLTQIQDGRNGYLLGCCMRRVRVQVVSLLIAVCTAFYVFSPGSSPVSAAGQLGSFQLGQGWATFGFAAPQGAVPAGEGVIVAGMHSQPDIKTKWNDGSMRFGVVSAEIRSAGNYSLSSGSNTAGAVSIVWPSTQLQCTMGGG